MDGLIIKDPWIGMVLDNFKSWEIRGSKTEKRGTIYSANWRHFRFL